MAAKRKRRAPKHVPAKILPIVFRRLADGESMRAICREEKMPDRESIRTWMKAGGAELLGQYARARREQGQSIADRVLEVAFDPDLSPEQKRVQIDALKWYAGKVAPKDWGDRPLIEIDQSQTVQVGIDREAYRRALRDPAARLAANTLIKAMSKPEAVVVEAKVVRKRKPRKKAKAKTRARKAKA